tara:strand:+ start:1730 stop:2245 length:516 start_codon:yes stop_codon:yes gene_type:complete
MTSRAEMTRNLIGDNWICAELGVDRGAFSSTILATSNCAGLYSIDRWAGDRGHDAAQEEEARALLGRYGGRSSVIKSSFSDALDMFPEGFFDLIYIDGYAHTGQEGGDTLRDWWPKLRERGVFAGHDYSPSWPKTVERVDDFAKKLGLTINVTNGHDEYESWWVVKPCNKD